MPEQSIENIDLRSEEVQEILQDVPNWMIRRGSTLLFALFLMLLFISWIVKYPDTFLAEAVVTTHIPPQKLHSKITSRISAILVEDNQEVSQNQPLAVLENTANHEDVFLLKSILDASKINNKELDFPFESLPPLSLGDIDSEFALFENSYVRYLLHQDLDPNYHDKIANQFALVELKKRLKSLQSQKLLNNKELALRKKSLIRQEELFEKEIIAIQDFESEQIKFSEAERLQQSLDASTSQVKSEIIQLEKLVRDAGMNAIREEMTLRKDLIHSANQLKKALKDWEQQYVISSKIAGTVTYLEFWNINQTIKQGDQMFSIIPDENSLLVGKLKAPSQNSGKVNVGQTVFIELDSYPQAEFGMLKGFVKRISLSPGQDGLYFIDVTLPNNLMTTYNKKVEFKQEMSGTAKIVTKDLRLAQRFFYQFRAIFET